MQEYVGDDGSPEDQAAFQRGIEKDLHEAKLLAAGGYVPSDADPRNCEPVPPETKGGFALRVENEWLEPFDRCYRIGCQVQEQCTALVQAALEKK